MTDKPEPPELRTCPWCGRVPRIQLGKKTNCQLHGDPMQPIVIRCATADCMARPHIETGDVHNGGEDQARAKAIAAWNRRAPMIDPADEGLVELIAAAIANARAGRRGAPAVSNVLTLIKSISGGKLYDEVMDDARAVVAAISEEREA